MEICITDIGVEDAARILESMALILQNSAEHGDLPSEVYADAFELMGCLAAAIKGEAGCAA